MDPVEWAKWIYGKWFIGHSIMGLSIILFVSFAVVGAFVTFIWLKGVDKYRDEHPTPAQVQHPGQSSPDLSNTKQTLITALDQFNLEEGAELKDISNKVVSGCFELSANPTPSASPGHYSRVAVTTKVNFSTHYYASVRLDASQDVQTMDFIGRDIWIGISPDWKAFYIWETEQLQNTWAVKQVERLTINTLAIYQQGKDISVFINNNPAPVATYTKKYLPKPGPVGIQLKANQLRGGKMVFRDFSVWDYEM